MRLPLIVMGLLFMALLTAYAFFQSRKEKRPAPAWGQGRKAASGQAMAEMISDTLRIYVLLAGGALLSIAFGKPGLVQQYAAWAVVGLQAIKCFAIYKELAGLGLLLRLAVLACLAYLWINLLPVFDNLPQ